MEPTPKQIRFLNSLTRRAGFESHGAALAACGLPPDARITKAIASQLIETLQGWIAGTPSEDAP